jgi:outer membrane protein OmpA-like peptidoglycan-associated protein
MDLMVSHRDETGIWSTPQPLPAPINTAYNEKSPFLHPDGKTLYFASDRVPGGGGYDLWRTHLDTDGNWSPPANIGAPVNTEQDEHGMVVDIDGQTAFFSGRRTGTKGLDILSFPLSDRFQPEAVLLIQGAVLTPEGMPALNAKVTLENLGSSGERKELQIREDNGQFATIIAKPEMEESWVLTTEGEGIAFDAVEVKAPEGEAVATADLQARALVLNAPLEMRNIEFPTDESTLDASAELILKAFAGYLTRQPQYHVRLEGHTDNTGLPEKNAILSQNRAQAARQFLIEQGIESHRIGARGYGDQKPIASNDSEAGRAANRRTEFVIFVP